ncbi:hypothetical protein SO694_00025271 [Aureococcus anophagefferens]|uniref:Uncharacterized protein n=1 Tax=Aureococcus anophagefferens TaxID=44056 RepID=A0ABR1FVF4_AURAN
MLKNKMRNEEAMEQLLRHMSAAEDVELPEVDRATPRGARASDPRPSPGRRGRAGRDLADGDAVGAARPRAASKRRRRASSRAAGAAGRARAGAPRGDVYGSAVDADSSAPEAAVWCPHEANDVDQPSPPKPPRCDYDDACVAEWADAYAPKFLPRA